MASTNETEVKSLVEVDETEVKSHVEVDDTEVKSPFEVDDGDDDFLRDAIEAILPLCGGCEAAPCRYGFSESDRVFLKCCIKEGFGSCGFFKWLDPQKIAESQQRIKEIAKKCG